MELELKTNYDFKIPQFLSFFSIFPQIITSKKNIYQNSLFIVLSLNLCC